MKFDAAINEDRAEVRKANKKDRYEFQLKLSIGHNLRSVLTTIHFSRAVTVIEFGEKSCKSCLVYFLVVKLINIFRYFWEREIGWCN